MNRSATRCEACRPAPQETVIGEHDLRWPYRLCLACAHFCLPCEEGFRRITEVLETLKQTKRNHDCWEQGGARGNQTKASSIGANLS